MTANSSQTVETILGPIPINELGETLTHEHLGSLVLKKKINANDSDYITTTEISAKNIRFLDYCPYFYKLNVNLCDDETVRNMPFELTLFKQNHGKTIVNTNSYKHETDLFTLRTISKMTGVNIIIGSGVLDYTTIGLKKQQNLTQEYLYNILKHDLIHGRQLFQSDESPLIKSAFIGETPCYELKIKKSKNSRTTELTEYDKIFISATGQVQEELHCPVTFYPGNNPETPKKILKLYKEAGGDSSKAIISHVDFVFSKKQKFMEFMDDHNCYVEFSLFGNPYSIDDNFNILSDSQRIKRIKRLKEEGKLNRVLMSHDIHTKNRLVSYGGLGFSHISKNILPYMLKRGFDTSDIKTLTIENPKNWLSYDKTHIV